MQLLEPPAELSSGADRVLDQQCQFLEFESARCGRYALGAIKTVTVQ